MALFKNRRAKKDEEAVEAVQSTKVLFRPYYLNDEKINDFFVQEYGGLTGFTKTHGKEIASSLGVALSANVGETRGPRGITVEGGGREKHAPARKQPPGSCPRSDGGDRGRA